MEAKAEAQLEVRVIQHEAQSTTSRTRNTLVAEMDDNVAALIAELQREASSLQQAFRRNETELVDQLHRAQASERQVLVGG